MMDTQDLQQQPLSVEEDLVAAAVYRLTLPPAPACHLPDQRLIVLSQSCHCLLEIMKLPADHEQTMSEEQQSI